MRSLCTETLCRSLRMENACGLGYSGELFRFKSHCSSMFAFQIFLVLDFQLSAIFIPYEKQGLICYVALSFPAISSTQRTRPMLRALWSFVCA